jgi:hypothetical protein
MANLTRIKNNQITDSTILANTKIVPGSIVGSLFSPTLTMTSDVTITGNLTVQGASTYLTVASTNTYVNDPLIVLNNAFSGTNSYDLGFVFNRGTLQNTALIWNESNKEFRLVGTTETGTTYGSINQSNFANLSVGNLTVQYATSVGSLSVPGTVSVGAINASGNVNARTVLAQLVTSDDATFGNVAAGFIGNTATVFTGESINLSGNVLSAGAVHNALTVNGTASATTFSGAGTSLTGTASGLSIGGSAPAGSLTGSTLNSGVTASSLTSVGILGSLNVSGNILSAGAVHNTLTVNGTGVFGNVYAAIFGNAGAVITGTTGAFSGNVVGGLGQFAAINATPIGNATPSTGVFTTATAGAVSSGFIGNTGTVFNGTTLNVTGNVIAATVLAQLVTSDDATFGNVEAGFIGNTATIFTGASINLSGNVLSAGAVHNALTVNGNESVTGYLNVSGNVMTAQLNAGQINTTGNVLATGLVGSNLVVNTGNINAVGGYFVGNGAFLTGVLATNIPIPSYIQLNQSNVIVQSGGNILANVNGTVITTFNSTGIAVTGTVNASSNVLAQAGTFNALTVNGNESVTGYLNVSGNVSTAQLNAGQINTTGNVLGAAATFSSAQINGNIVTTGYLNVAGNVLGSAGTLNTLILNSTTNATGQSTGALQVAGGASFTQDVWIGGNLFVSNIIGVSANVITVQDPLLYLRPGVTSPYNYDIGFYSAFTGVGLGTISQYQHTSIFRDPTNNTWTFVSNLAEPTASYITIDVNSVYDPIKAGSLNLTNTTASTTTGSGALIVAGGAGIAGAVTAGSFNTAGNLLAAGGIFNALTVNGYTNVNGNISTAQLNAGQINTTGNLLAASAVLGTLTVNGVVTNQGVNAAGNVVAQGGIFNALTVNGNETVTGLITTAGINSSANILATGGIFNALTVNGNETVTGYLNVSGNVLSAGATHNSLTVNGNTSLGLAGAVSGSWTTVVGNITQTSSGGPVYFNTTGNVSASQLIASTLSTRSNYGNIHLTQFASIFAQGNNSENQSIIQVSTTGLSDGMGMWGFTGLNGTLFSSRGINFVTGVTVRDQDTPTGGVTKVAITAAGDLWANSTTPATNSTTGALVVAGGVGIGGNLYVGAGIQNTAIGNVTASTGAFTSLTATGTVYANATTASTTATNGALVVAGAVGISGNLVLSSTSNVIAGGSAGTNGQYLVSTGTGVQWQTLTVAAGAYITQGGSNVTVTQNYVNVAINSGNVAIFRAEGISAAIGAYSANTAQFTTLSASQNVTFNNYSGYLKAAGGSPLSASGTIPNTDITGLGSMSTQNSTSISVSGGSIDGTSIGSSTAAAGRFTTITGTSTTDTTGVATGAVQIAGGVDIAKSLFVNTGAVFNGSQSANVNFQVKGQYANTAIYTTGNTVVIGGSNTAVQVGATLKINSTDSLLLPVGTTGQRPSSLPGGSDLPGMLRYNTSRTNLEYYDGSAWQTPGATTTLIIDQQFSGDGSANVFTLSNSSSTSAAIVSVNGILQIPTTAYSVSGTALTFTEAPAVGDSIDVRIIAATQTVTSLASASGFNVFDVSDAGSLYANISTGSTSATPRISVTTTGTINLVNSAKIAVQNTAVNIAANATPYVLDTFTQTLYTSAKYIITAKNAGLSAYETAEVILVTDQNNNAYISTFGVVNNGSPLGGFTANVLGGNVQLYYTSNTNGKGVNSNVRVYTTYIA